MEDRTCKNCANSKRVKTSIGKNTYPCQLGYDIFMSCQGGNEFGSGDEYFEPKKERKK